MDRVEAAQAKLRDVVKFAYDAEKAGPPCRNCHHWRSDGTCGDLANAVQTFEPSTGRYRESYAVTLDIARSEAGLCGPEAILFAPRRGTDLLHDMAERAGKGWKTLLQYSLLFWLGFLLLREFWQ